jgi:radical SAM-linked protein
VGKLRLVFAKEGRAVYLSHLDLLRTFQRVFLREGLVLRHSQGYHPHPILSFALPLPVGQSSDCEILDFEVDGDLDAAALPVRLNAFMPEGIRAKECYVPVKPVRDLAYLQSRVELLYDGGAPEDAAARIEALLTGESVVIQKRTKRKELADVDIRPMLQSLTISRETEGLVLNAVVSAQNPGLNPALLAAAVERHLPELRPDFVRVRRLAVLDGQGNIFR